MRFISKHRGCAPVKRVMLPGGRRILCVSDIHGNLPWLRGLLEKVRYTSEDVLVLVGDLFEKGGHSLALLRFLMALGEEGPVYPVRGNCDGWDIAVDNETDGEMDEGTRHYLSLGPPWRTEALLAQMCREAGVEISPDMDMRSMKARLRETFKAELDYLRGLPTILDTEFYTFVHAGLPEPGPLEGQSADRCEKTDAFLRLNMKFDKWLIVGHWPVMDYGGDVCNLSPLVDPERRIASIDGGCVVKDYGQLNALIIPENGSEEFGFEAYDDFPLCRVVRGQKESESSVFIRYGDNIVDILAEGEAVCLCRHVRTGRIFEAPANFLKRTDSQVVCRDFTDYAPALAPGEPVSLIEETALGAVVKKDWVLGLYRGEFN